MLPLDHPDRIQISFDDHRLVANAGLIPPSTLARHLGPAPTRRGAPRPGQCPGPGEPGRQDDDAGGFRPGRRRSRLHAPHPPFRRRPVRWIWAKNSGEYGRLHTSVRRAINGSSSPRGRSTAQESLLRWRRTLESGWRRELPTKLIYVTVIGRTTAAINKAEDAGGWMPIGFADALQGVFLTTVASYLPFRGWIGQETLCDRSSVTFVCGNAGGKYG